MTVQRDRRLGVGRVDGLRERKRRQTREQIAQAELDLFLRQGIEATTVDEIAAEVGVFNKEGIAALKESRFR